MIRQPVTPAALQPKPIAMVRACFPQALQHWKGRSRYMRSGQITKIFQKGKEREENGHGWKHDRDNPGQYPVYTQNQNPVEPLGRIDCHKSSGKFFLKGEKREEAGRKGSCSCDRQPENERQKTNHSRISGQPPGQDAIPKSIPFAVGFQEGRPCGKQWTPQYLRCRIRFGPLNHPQRSQPDPGVTGPGGQPDITHHPRTDLCLKRYLKSEAGRDHFQGVLRPASGEKGGC